MPRTTYLTDPCEYFDMLTSSSQQVNDVSFVSNEMVRMQWVNDDSFIEQSGKTNVVIAAYTTAQARLKLFSYLHRLGDRALYADTDSVIFTTKPGEWEPDLDNYLGGMTDEVPDKEIKVFITAGAKNYAYKLNDGSTCCKVRGITLNCKNLEKINFETISAMVKNRTDPNITVVDDQKISRDTKLASTVTRTEEKDIKTRTDHKINVVDDHKISRDTKHASIVTRTAEKDYRLVFDKRVIKDTYMSVPYGM